MCDYKRRVSSNATVKASYEAFSTGDLRFLGYKFPRPMRADLEEASVDGLQILGLAAGGQMYGTRDLKLLIVSFIS